MICCSLCWKRCWRWSEALLVALLFALIHQAHCFFMDALRRCELLIVVQCPFSGLGGLTIALKPVQIVCLDRPDALVVARNFQQAINRLACLLKSSKGA